MPSDRKSELERELEASQLENADLKKTIDLLSRQVYGRVMPGLYAIPAGKEDVPTDVCVERSNRVSETKTGVLHESAASYHVSESVHVPSDLPSDEVKLELPPSKSAGLSVIAYESAEAVAVRSPVVRRTIRRAMYVSDDGSGMASAAPVPALFPDPSGGGLLFDASFVAYVTDFHLAGMSFRTISERLNLESGLVISETALRELVLSAAETIAPVCAALVVRTLPDWMNLRRMFEDAKAGGDWLADEFLKGIHALCELEEHARIRAERLGGAPEDLYRERRAVRLESARIAKRFFERCRELLPAQNPQSPLGEALRHAVEHEKTLSEFLYDPRLELSRANPETPVADPFAMLAVCADECRLRGVIFRTWLDDTLAKLKQPNPPPPELLFPPLN